MDMSSINHIRLTSPHLSLTHSSLSYPVHRPLPKSLPPTILRPSPIQKLLGKALHFCKDPRTVQGEKGKAHQMSKDSPIISSSHRPTTLAHTFRN